MDAFEMMNQYFILILLCLFSLLFYFLFFKKPKQKLNLPPSPPSLPIIGHLHHLLLSSLAHKSLMKLSSKYGPLLHLRIFNFSTVLVSSPSMAYEIFKTQDVNISRRGLPVADESLLLGAYTFVAAPYGEYWKFMKKLLVKNMLGPQAIERSRSIRAKELNRFYLNLMDKARKKEKIEMSKEVMKLTTNSTCKMLMGRSCSVKKGETERFGALVAEFISLTKKCLLASIFRKIGISLFKTEILSVSGRFDELIEKILQEREENTENNGQDTCMMDALLEAYNDENAEFKITRNHIKSFIVEMLIGGTETSAQATQWTMAEIINNPHILSKLRKEIESVVGNSRLIQETDLPNLPYLQAVVKEGLRFHPQSTMFPRLVEKSCKIGGFDVTEKTTIVINSYAVMRDPKSWEDPNEFIPERFLDSSKSSSNVEDEIEREGRLKYIPFGAGRRGCPGTSVAYIFVGTAIGTMVQCFDWIIEGVGTKVNIDEAVAGLSLIMANPIKCIPVPRSNPTL